MKKKLSMVATIIVVLFTQSLKAEVNSIATAGLFPIAK